MEALAALLPKAHSDYYLALALRLNCTEAPRQSQGHRIPSLHPLEADDFLKGAGYPNLHTFYPKMYSILSLLRKEDIFLLYDFISTFNYSFCFSNYGE